MKNVARWMGGAVVALIAVAVAYRYHRSDDLVGAAELLDYRVAEARLTGGFAYRPLQPVVRSSRGDSLGPPLGLLLAATRTRPTDLHALGRSRLLLQHWDSAADVLDAAVRQQTQREQLADALAASTDAELLADLAAAHHALARHGGEARHYVIAVEAAERAWRLEKTPEVAWNRALAIESLHMREDAVAAWKEYLALDPDSQWAVEVPRHLRDLAAPTPADEWASEQRHLDPTNDAELWRMVQTFPGEVRLLANSRLTEWAKTRDDRTLAFCRAAGGAMQRMNGESLMADTVAQIDRANPTRREQVIRGLLVFGEARQLYTSARMSEAVAKFLAAFEILDRAGNPFAQLARMYVLSCERLTDSRAALASSDAWLASGTIDEHRHLALMAQIRWIRGLANLRVGRPQAAIDEYSRAREIFERLGERDNATSMALTLSEAYDYVGDSAGAWRHRLLALEQLDAKGKQQPMHLELFRTSAASALQDGMPCVAVLFLDRQIAACGTPAEFDMRFHALLLRAKVRRILGDAKGAAADLLEARRVGSKIPDAEYREAAQFAPDVIADRLSTLGDRQQRTSILRGAIDFARQKNLAMPLAELYLQQAREFVGLSQWEAAEAALFAGIESLEQERETIADTAQRGSFLDARRAVYDMLIELLCSRHEYGRAFDVVERSRARTLLDLMSGKPRNLAEIQAALPDDTVLVEFARVDNKHGVWLVARRTFEFVEVATGEREIAGHAAALRIALRADQKEAMRITRALYDALIRPWYGKAAGFGRLVFVGETVLGQVPFAALHDGEQYLIERHAIVIAPSANVLLASMERDAARARAAGVALVVAPSYDSNGELPVLSASRREAEDVARQYPNAVLLQGAGATREAFVTHVTGAKIVHFAGHSTARRATVPRLAFAGEGKAETTFMHAEDIRDLKLPVTRVVMLASCESGVEHTAADTQGVSSLARAFLAAGAPAVVGSYWEISDDETSQLSRRFHAYFQRGYDAAAALRLAQLDILRSPDARINRLESWAAFAVIGGAEESTTRR